MDRSDTKLSLLFNAVAETVVDYSDDGVTMTEVSPSYSATTKYGTGMIYSGAGEAARAAASTNWQPQDKTNWMFECWSWTYHADPWDHDEHMIVPGASNNWKLRWTSSLLSFILTYAGAAQVTLSVAVATARYTWYHMVVGKVGTDWGLYLDGVQIAYVSSAFATAFTAAVLHLCDGSQQSNGTDFVRIIHENPYGLAPVVGLTDSFGPIVRRPMPWPHKVAGDWGGKTVNGVPSETISTINGVA